MTTQHLDTRPALPPADWYPDPVGRHQYRYYDGAHWTDHVADDGRVQIDPMNPAPPPEATLVTPVDEAPAAQPEHPITVKSGFEQPAGAGQPAEEPLILAPETPWPETVPSTPRSLLEGDLAPTLEPDLPGTPAGGSTDAATAAAPAGPQPALVVPPPSAPTTTPPGMPPVTERDRPVRTPTLSLDEAVRRCLRGYVSFAGRASRSEYWWFAVTVNLALGVVAFAGVALFGGLISDPEMASVLSRLPYGLLSLGLLPPMLSAAVRRLHDTGRSGTMLLLALIPLAGPVIVLVFLASPGTPGDNQYGTTPTPVGDPPQILPTIIAAARIPLQYLLIGIASLTMFRFVIHGQVGFWGLWSNGLGGWFLMTLTTAAAVAVMLAMRRTIPSRWLLWLEVATAAVIAAAPWAPGTAALWFDWPELLGAPLLIISGRILAMAWLGVVLVSAFPRLQASPGSTT
jgi:uncharacterized membrane protein YhaH (DUF805 family)